MNEEQGDKKAGRPKGPEKVVFKRRVLATTVPELEALILCREGGDARYKGFVVQPAIVAGPTGSAIVMGDVDELRRIIDEQRKQNMQLCEENEKLALLQQCHDNDMLEMAMKGLDDKGKLGWRKYYELLNAKKKAGEFDQEVS